MDWRHLAAALTAVGGLGSGFALAAPTGIASRVPYEDSWHDLHDRYPAVPSGAAGIVKAFGPACGADARANTYYFVASDDGYPYPVHFHKRLGGTESSNLDNDIPGHIERAKLSSKLLRGIWGYTCRYKRNVNEYSAHAWGIAVDVNSAHEIPGKPCRTVPSSLGSVWTQHRWTWGAAWNDCMHFQYAKSY